MRSLEPGTVASRRDIGHATLIRRPRRRLTTILLAGSLLAVALPGLARTPAAAAATPHVWVHWDYMVTADGRSEAPDPAAMQQVVDAFAAHGIVLFIDPTHTAIPEHTSITTDWPGGIGCFGASDQLFNDDWVSYEALKAAYFHPASNHPWHYAIFGLYLDGGVSSGCAALPGYDFVVADGRLRDIHLDTIDPARFRQIQAADFMHELGHNLGLHHGGDVDANWKPNYLSVMNYAFSNGIPYAAMPGSTALAGFRLDYSGVVLPTLDEAHLDETAGIGGSGTDMTAFAGEFGFGLGPAQGPIDWNLDGNATETDIAVDLDYGCLGCVGGTPDSYPPQYERMTGFDDWAEIASFIVGEDKHPKVDGPADP